MTDANDRAKLFSHAALLLACGAFAAFGAGCGGDTNDSANAGGAGGGGGNGSGGQNSGIDCSADFMPTDPTAVVDTMEDGDGLIAQVADRNGSWWVTSDGTAEGTITPPSGAAPPPERILGGRCGSQRAIRVTGQGFTNWGAVLSAGMGYDGVSTATDASSFKGIMFWARVGETNNSHIRVQMQDSHTYPEGGVCNTEPGTPDECYNGFGTEVAPIDTTWRLYKIPFARVAQRDFGFRSDTFDTAQIYTIEFNLDANAVFDLWVDDVWFYE